MKLSILFFSFFVFFLPIQVFSQDFDKGKKVYRKCKACHTIAQGAKHRVGPNLYKIIDKKAGTAEGYRYSKAMKNSELIWSVENLSLYLVNPRKFIKGTKMAFAGLKKETDITNVIYYINEMSKKE